MNLVVLCKNRLPFSDKVHILGDLSRPVVELMENGNLWIALHSGDKLTISQDTVLDLMHENNVAARIKIKLSLITELAHDVMQRVDGVIPRLGDNRLAGTIVGHVATSISVVQAGSAASAQYGSCLESLGTTMNVIVNIMNKVAHVRLSRALVNSHTVIYKVGYFVEQANPILNAAWTVLSSVHKVNHPIGSDISVVKVLSCRLCRSRWFRTMLFLI
jgi:hypothetical protein